MSLKEFYNSKYLGSIYITQQNEIRARIQVRNKFESETW